MKNFFDLPPDTGEEIAQTLCQTTAFRAERIISRGQASPQGFWYDQEEDEWVLVVSGEALLETETGSVRLSSGDSLLLPAHFRHRVQSTSENPPCLWLCIYGKKLD